MRLRIKNSRNVKHRHAMHCHLTLIRERRRSRKRWTINRYGTLRNRESTTIRGDKSAQIEGLARRGWPTTCAHEQPLTRAWNQAPARTSARLGGRRTIRIDILINERPVGPMSELLVRQKGRVRECGEGNQGGGEGWTRGRIRTRVFDGVATTDAWPEARVCRALRTSFCRKRHSRSPLALVRLFVDTVVRRGRRRHRRSRRRLYDTFLNKQYVLPNLAATLEKVWSMVPPKKDRRRWWTELFCMILFVRYFWTSIFEQR